MGGDTPYTLDACFGSAGNARQVVCRNLSHLPPSSPTPSYSHAPRLRPPRKTSRLSDAIGTERSRIVSSRQTRRATTGQVEHFVHALMENNENTAPMYTYTHIGQAKDAVAD